MTRQNRQLVQHIFYLLASFIAAYLFVRSGVVHDIVQSVGGLTGVGSLVAGVFFTSVFTTAPAVVVLGELGKETAPWIVALFGAVGAATGDYLLFLVVRKGLSGDVEYVLKHAGFRRLRHVFSTRLSHRLLPIMGALVLASPLPDELGLALLGLAKIPRESFLIISFAMNFLGILTIVLVARSLGA